MTISTESYKGVRDFYPEDKFIQKYIFSKMRETVESFGYVEYDASILEYAELYKAKSGSELVNEQTYTFTDRGDREVTMRPEMTPTVARMVAQKQRELAFPLRWYSIPNLFRYEKPQRGRLREHWQLNVDMFGIDTLEADIEVITIAYEIMKNLGAKDEDFIIRLNSRKLMKDVYAHFNLSEEESYTLSKIIDRKAKISESEYADAVRAILKDNTDSFLHMTSTSQNLLEQFGESNEHVQEVINAINLLLSRGVSNVVFDPNLMRGLDYYTGLVFEVFDTHKDNNRSIFGGGRYDDLLDIFGAPKVPAFGFGMGDVGAQNFLEVHNLLPEYHSSSQVTLCPLSKEFITNADNLASALRKEHINVSVDYTGKKIGDQIKLADRQHVPYVIVIGSDEIQSDIYTIKHLETGEEHKGSIADVVEVVNRER